MASLARGERLGPYEAIEKIGAGGMGDVWKARDNRLDRVVALKVSREQFTERFEREARAVAAINHPHICTLYDIGPNYLVMEYIEGKPLEGPLPLAQAVEYAGQILDALDAAHRKGITHRDLKPANILVTKQGIKLLDFGLAKQRTLQGGDAATVTQALTMQGQIVGTLQYMAPEQLQGMETDARSDLFAFGCVLYEMLTGKRAFDGQSAASVIAAILEREPEPLTAAPPLDRVVRRSLAKDPDQRFQTARDLKASLNWAMEQPAPMPSTVARPGQRWHWIVAATLVIGALGGWALSKIRQPQPDHHVFRLQVNPPEGGQFAFGAVVGGLAISPDGRTAAFVASGNSRILLWIRLLDGSTAKPIAGTEGAAFPFWSPDSKSIGFFTSSQMKRVDLAGGTPSRVCDVALGRGGAWTDSGRIVFGTLSSGLFEVQAGGGTPAQLTKVDPTQGDLWHRWPQILPGGRVLYFIETGKPETTGAYVYSPANPRLHLLATPTDALYAPGGDGRDYLLWVRGGALVGQAFNPATLQITGDAQMLADHVATSGLVGATNASVSTGGVLFYSASSTLSRLTWFDRSGKRGETVGDQGEYNGALRISPDGRRVAAPLDRIGGSDLWLLDIQRGSASRLTFASGISIYPIWSPDNRTIVFSASTPRNLFRTDASGAGTPQRLMNSPTNVYPNDWSRDGHWLLYHEIALGTGRDLWVAPVSADGTVVPGAAPKSYVKTQFSESWGRFSPESTPRWVAYQSDSSGQDEIYVQAFPEPRGKFQISTGGGQYPQWGPDGRELYYMSPDYKLMMVTLKIGPDSVEASTPRELFPMPIADNGLSPYDTAADGQHFLVRATAGQASQPLTVLVNWPALLKREGPQ